MDNSDVTRNRTPIQWLAIADQWHWEAVELHCDADTERRKQSASDIASLSTFADYAMRRAQIAAQILGTPISASD
ncbi:hypothetical protein [Streptomyces violaceusniger]|uniref:hypothetical protein n=1 Tax=Streptomyces violaceusniger TaxID=68280 RepID=UPI0036B0BCDA